MASFTVSPTKTLANKAVCGMPVVPATKTVRAARVCKTVCSAQKESLIAPVVAATIVAASLVVPEVAHATEVSPSVANLLKSVVSGGLVVGLIFGAVTAVSGFDTVNRK